MNEVSQLEQLNSRVPPFFKILGGTIVEIDKQCQSATLHFDISTDLCHSVDIVQGGFITAMLDAAMSHAVFAVDREVRTLSSLEISTRYLDVARAGFLVAVGRVTRASYKTAFLEGELRDGDGKLLATTHSVAKLGRKA
ncbi:MAG: PaaI family thioesterase [Pseudomonadota bacterium]